jgi:hypothetical protein
MNRITLATQGDGTQVWTNTDLDTSGVITYQFVPASTLHAGDRVEVMRQFAPGRGNTRSEGARVLTAQDITDLTAKPGSFVRVKELSFQAGQAQVVASKSVSTPQQPASTPTAPASPVPSPGADADRSGLDARRVIPG